MARPDGTAQQTQLLHSPQPWPRYVERLVEIAAGSGEDDRIGRGALSRGWAIGTTGWRKSVARDHLHLAVAPEMTAEELRELKLRRWERELEAGLAESGGTLAKAADEPKGARWKIALSVRLRTTVAAPWPWNADRLKMGTAASVRVYVCQAN